MKKKCIENTSEERVSEKFSTREDQIVVQGQYRSPPIHYLERRSHECDSDKDNVKLTHVLYKTAMI